MSRAPDDLVPLSPLTMSILLALADGDAHGYALMKDIERQTRGVLKPGTGSLYAALQRLIDGGLIEESPRAPAPGEDPRRKHYRVTDEGRQAVRSEAERMMRVLQIASERALAPAPDAGERS